MLLNISQSGYILTLSQNSSCLGCSSLHVVEFSNQSSTLNFVYQQRFTQSHYASCHLVTYLLEYHTLQTHFHIPLAPLHSFLFFIIFFLSDGLIQGHPYPWLMTSKCKSPAQVSFLDQATHPNCRQLKWLLSKSNGDLIKTNAGSFYTCLCLLLMLPFSHQSKDTPSQFFQVESFLVTVDSPSLMPHAQFVRKYYYI